MSEEEILNWRWEEQQYINKAIENYYKNKNIFASIFTSEKQERKNIDYITTNAKLEFRKQKLDKMLDCIEQERARMNDVVSWANKELKKMLKEISIDLPDKELFEIKVRPEECYEVLELPPMEAATIELKPYKIHYIQQSLH